MKHQDHHCTLAQNRGSYGHTNVFELEKCYLHENGVEIDEELNGMPYYDLWTKF